MRFNLQHRIPLDVARLIFLRLFDLQCQIIEIKHSVTALLPARYSFSLHYDEFVFKVKRQFIHLNTNMPEMPF